MAGVSSPDRGPTMKPLTQGRAIVPLYETDLRGVASLDRAAKALFG